MKKLSLILGGVALGAVGYGLKVWYNKTKEENAYWTDKPSDIFCEMAGEAAEKMYEGVEWLEKKVLGEESLNLADVRAIKNLAERSEEGRELFAKSYLNQFLQLAEAKAAEAGQNPDLSTPTAMPSVQEQTSSSKSTESKV